LLAHSVAQLQVHQQLLLQRRMSTEQLFLRELCTLNQAHRHQFQMLLQAPTAHYMADMYLHSFQLQVRLVQYHLLHVTLLAQQLLQQQQSQLLLFL